MAIRIALAADEDFTLLGAQTLLEREYRYHMIGSARTFGELLRVLDLKPDVLVINDWLAGLHITRIAEKLKQHRRLKLITMSGVSDGLFIHDLLASGIHAYLHKQDSLQDCLAPAIDTVLSGAPYLSPTARTSYIIAMQTAKRNNQLNSEALSVLQLLAQGVPIGKISFELGLPIRRVYWVRDKLRHRFDATTNEHLIYCAMVQGVI